MKTIPVEELNDRLTKALEQQDEHEPIGLTQGAGTVAWVVRVPQSLRDSEADVVAFQPGPEGRIYVLLEVKSAAHAPVFGAGRGTLTVLSEDDEHLKDFQEYMK